MSEIKPLDFRTFVDNAKTIEKLLRSVVDNDPGYTIETEIASLVSGQSYGLVVNDFEALAVIEFINTPVQRVCWLKWTAGKNMDKWLPGLLNYVEEAAKTQGCKLVEFNGRLGYLRKYGALFPDYKVTQIVVRKEL